MINLQSLKLICQKMYEERCIKEHQLLCGIFMDVVEGCSQKLAQLYSLYTELLFQQNIVISRRDYGSSPLIILISTTNPEDRTLTTLSTNKPLHINSQDYYVLIISQQNLLKSKVLHETSISEEISFLHKSQYLNQMPKKKLYNIIRNSGIKKYCINDIIYRQKEMIVQNGIQDCIYLVRKGVFQYKKEVQQGALKLYSFSEGHIFGAEEIMQNQRLELLENKRREFTVICKSGEGVVYRISLSFFNNHLKFYCDSFLQKTVKKLKKFIDNQIAKMTDKRQEFQSYLSQSSLVFKMNQTKSQSESIDAFRSYGSLTFKKYKQIESQRDIPSKKQDQNKKNDIFPSLMMTKSTSLGKNKLHSKKDIQPSNEFIEQQKLIEKKMKCMKMRELSTNSTSQTRGEIMFNMLKTCWNFEKSKKKRLHK